MSTEDEDRRRKLAVVAVELAAEVAQLTKVAQAQSEALAELKISTDKAKRRTTVKIRVLVALFIADIALTAAIYVFYNKQAETSARLEAAIAQQEVIRSQVLCPLYAVFLGSYQPTTRAAGTDRDTYEQNFAQMRTQYAVLSCTGPVVPPRVDLPPPAK